MKESTKQQFRVMPWVCDHSDATVDRMSREFEHYQHMEAHEAFEIASRPIVKRMCDIRLLFTRPWMKFADGRIIESGEEWTDEGARNLYAALEETIRVLERMYLTPPP